MPSKNSELSQMGGEFRFPARVEQLDEQTIHRIAAGEVVDRPASALKELIENSLDAGATEIKIQIGDGGLGFLEVTDNGHGIRSSDLNLCFQRHATSKIRHAEDLDRILSFGFRGEALAAISSVSELFVQSRFQSAENAFESRIVHGVVGKIIPSSRSVGTKIRIENLFDLVPARKKFLKSATVEGRYSWQVVKEMAMAHPQCRFEAYWLNSGGEIKASLESEICTLQKRFQDLADIDEVWSWSEEEDLSPGVKEISIAMGAPPNFAKNQKSIFLSVNGRCVFDKSLPYALREAMSSLIEVGRFPIMAIQIEVDPNMIDVNIHPQKREIRWPVTFSLASQIYREVKKEIHRQRKCLVEKVEPVKEEPSSDNKVNSLSQPSLGLENFSKTSGSKIPVQSRALKAESNSNGFKSARATNQVIDQSVNPSIDQWDLQKSLKKSEENGSANSPERINQSTSTQNRSLSEKIIEDVQELAKSEDFTAKSRAKNEICFSKLRVIGESGAAWIIAEDAEGMILIDQHAAHERVKFEELLESPDLLESEPLLLNWSISVDRADKSEVAQLRKNLESLGFEFSDASIAKNELVVIAIPRSQRKIDWKALIDGFFDKLEDGRLVQGAVEELRHKIASSLACHGSVRKGRRLKREEIEALLSSLDGLDWGGFCPHGRPIYFRLNHAEIEQRFHR